MGLELGQKVYLIYSYSITVDTVYAIGKDTFIRNGFDDSTILPVAWFFDDYEKRWFTDLEKAKKHLLNRFKHDAPYDTFKIVKVEDKYYEVQYAS